MPKTFSKQTVNGVDYAVNDVMARTGNDQEEIGLLKLMVRNKLEKQYLSEGYYNHSNPDLVGHGSTAKCLPPVRIFAGIPYTFRNVYAYFCPIVYDDGTVTNLADSASPATTTVSITPEKNGTVYVTINNGYDNTAMIVEGISGYTGAYFEGYTGVSKTIQTIITPNNYATRMPNWKTVDANSIYYIVSTKAMLYENGGLWTDVPLPLHRGQCVLTLQTIGNPGAVGTNQICTISDKGEIYVRYVYIGDNENVFSEWIAVGRSRNADIIIDKNGSGDFTSLSEGIKYATQFENAKVYVMPGTYNIIDEYEDLYGSTFFTNFDNSTSDIGLVLKNNVTVEFAPNAYVVCNYTGPNTYVQNKFSPFNSGIYGFTLINANVETHNVRYAMHDERSTFTDYYHNRYIGCHFDHDKGTGTGYKNALGGGLGKNGLIEIDNCIFESETSTDDILSWHNSRLAGARSHVFIRNSFVKGSIRFSWYGESTLVSTMMITDCKMYGVPVERAENQEYNTRNTEILAWGNEIGTPN